MEQLLQAIAAAQGGAHGRGRGGGPDHMRAMAKASAKVGRVALASLPRAPSRRHFSALSSLFALRSWLCLMRVFDAFPCFGAPRPARPASAPPGCSVHKGSQSCHAFK
eukprot:902732-Pyramimonas_sp.AAC.1